MTLLRDDELADYRAAIKKHGLVEVDFVLAEGKIEEPMGDGIEPLSGTVSVTFKPSGISSQYRTGHNTKWPYLFETDLSRGAFF